jgi:hypothetical protein
MMSLQGCAAPENAEHGAATLPYADAPVFILNLIGMNALNS